MNTQGYRSLFDNPQFIEAVRAIVSFDISDLIEVEDAEEATISLIDDLPGMIDEADPDLLTKFPARYAFYQRLRDIAGSELRTAERILAVEKSMLYKEANKVEPGHTPKLPKTTNQYVENWIRTNPKIQEQQARVDDLAYQYTVLCSGVEAMKMYFEALRDYLRYESYEQRYSRVTPSASPAVDPKQQQELARLKESVKTQKVNAIKLRG